MTLARLEALEERRAIKIRHARHDAAFIVATLFNVHRGGKGEAVSPFDFLPGFEVDPVAKEAEDRRTAAVRGVRAVFAMMPDKATSEQVKERIGKIIDRLLAQGYTDAEARGILSEAYPNL